MNSNYQWQKQQANERIQARMREAEVRRLVKGEASQGNSFLTRFWNKLRSGTQTAVSPQRHETGQPGRQESSVVSR